MKPVFKDATIRQLRLDIQRFNLGDVLVTNERGIAGFKKKFKVTKKTTTAVELMPYCWFDYFIDRIRKD